ncbi:hypothetical protein [Marimonas arenosa]|uniref:Uncharacterized protein n=1 Tax=Marimonas arenosa TaxID=1795305 RepID=A0AAE4B588_9RHOB|nr:hypothetical protein [Marimonas arenosa]MDQ2090109.1 hypothetical protein [Marimonas arenosa]
MQIKKRWIKTVIDTATRDTTAMPWQRGKRRSVSMARRRSQELKTRSA